MEPTPWLSWHVTGGAFRENAIPVMAARYRWVVQHVSDGLGVFDVSRVEDELRVEPNYSRLQVRAGVGRPCVVRGGGRARAL